jgi:glycerol-3-phosphate dehydrogenase
VNPYEGDLALIGTTDIAVEGKPEDARIDDREIDYLLGVLQRYFTAPPSRAEIVHAFSGVRPLYDDNAESPSAVTRDYIFDIDPKEPAPSNAPILSVFGGKITTYRKLAEHGLDRLRPAFPKMGAAWTAGASLPGGEIPGADFDGWLAGFRSRNAFLSADLAKHYGRLYGTRAEDLLDGARSLADLGRHFGALLYEREVDFLRHSEWAIDAEDILDRRTKHGLHLTSDERAAFTAWLDGDTVPRQRLSN